MGGQADVEQWEMRIMASQPKSGVISGLLKLLKASGHKQRASERSDRDVSVYLFSDTAFIGQANLIDESDGGAKVSSPTPDILKRARYLLNPNTATVNTLVLAWNSGREAGFRYSDKKRLRGYINDPKIEHVQIYWTSISTSHGINAPKGVFGRAR